MDKILVIFNGGPLDGRDNYWIPEPLPMLRVFHPDSTPLDTEQYMIEYTYRLVGPIIDGHARYDYVGEHKR